MARESRYVVTSLSSEGGRRAAIRRPLLRARDMENRIKDSSTCLRGAPAGNDAGQSIQMYLSGMAYVLVSGLRRLGLKATELATAQADDSRKLFKIGAGTVSVPSLAVDGIDYRARAFPPGLGEPALLKRRGAGAIGADTRGRPPRGSVPRGISADSRVDGLPDTPAQAPIDPIFRFRKTGAARPVSPKNAATASL